MAVGIGRSMAGRMAEPGAMSFSAVESMGDASPDTR